MVTYLGSLLTSGDLSRTLADFYGIADIRWAFLWHFFYFWWSPNVGDPTMSNFGEALPIFAECSWSMLNSGDLSRPRLASLTSVDLIYLAWLHEPLLTSVISTGIGDLFFNLYRELVGVYIHSSIHSNDLGWSWSNSEKMLGSRKASQLSNACCRCFCCRCLCWPHWPPVCYISQAVNQPPSMFTNSDKIAQSYSFNKLMWSVGTAQWLHGCLPRLRMIRQSPHAARRFRPMAGPHAAVTANGWSAWPAWRWTSQ